MLKHLYIRNFVLIDQLDLDFSSGFSAFTGETGAGKSIMIDAISILCGERASTSYITKGEEKSIIEGTFDLTGDQHAIEAMEAAGLDIADETTFTKELHRNGKTVCRIDHRIVTASLMKEILHNEIDIHGQRDTAYLLNTAGHIHLLDEFLGIQSQVNVVTDAFFAYDKLVHEKNRSLEETYNENDLEYFMHQVEEIDEAQLQPGEDEELQTKEKEYKSYKESIERFNQITGLYEESLSDELYELQRMVQGLDDMEPFEEIKKDIIDGYYQINDAMERLQHSVSSASMSEEEINEMEERLFIIQRLKRKYGRSIEAVLQRRDEIQQQINQITHRQEYLDQIDRKIHKALQKYQDLARNLTAERFKRAHLLDESIANILKELKLPNARFQTSMTTCEPSQFGNERVEFLIAMNQGEDFKPLAKTASGGELSRLMLGLKVIFSGLQGIQTVIFDEIDTGVSGSVATAIGRKMHALSQTCQVFAVTHLAQVAACADHHYLIAKQDFDGRTHTSIHQLDETEILEQLALIASGEVTDASLHAASELYQRNQSQE